MVTEKWTTRGGQTIPYAEMKHDHLANSIGLVSRWINDGSYPWDLPRKLDLLKSEMEQRMRRIGHAVAYGATSKLVLAILNGEVSYDAAEPKKIENPFDLVGMDMRANIAPPPTPPMPQASGRDVVYFMDVQGRAHDLRYASDQWLAMTRDVVQRMLNTHRQRLDRIATWTDKAAYHGVSEVEAAARREQFTWAKQRHDSRVIDLMRLDAELRYRREKNEERNAAAKKEKEEQRQQVNRTSSTCQCDWCRRNRGEA